MTGLFFTGDIPEKALDTPVPLPPPGILELDDPKEYIADDGLVRAVNVAIVLGQPLLLTGDPGTGKTQLAYALSRSLGLGEPLKFETKSNSISRDLFYQYDTVGRFHAAQVEDKTVTPRDFITYNALGEAILYAGHKEELNAVIPEADQHKYKTKRRSIVLIDEIDKAPRDFPNDILNEIELMYFRIPELQNAQIKADQEMRPLVIITSNSEKNLPDAFLRRCIFYHIAFPDKEDLQKIVQSRLGAYLADSADFQEDALDLFYKLRAEGNGIEKKPATAELLGWIIALKKMSKDKPNPMLDNGAALKSSLSALIKNIADLGQAQKILEGWEPPSRHTQ